jgi:hypothetical protein
MTITRAILVTALALGIAADLLLRNGFDGIGFALWIALVALGALVVSGRARLRLTTEARGWLAVGAVAAACMAWRASPQLQALDFLTTLFALGVAAVVIGAPSAGLHAARLRDTVWAGGRVLRDVFVGAVPLTLRELLAPSTRSMANQRGRPAARAVLIVVALLAVFGTLLRAADPVFASLVAFPDIDLGRVASHVILTGFFAWVFAGWARGAFVTANAAGTPPAGTPATLGMADVNAALGTLVALFAIYVATQIGVLFGGERFLQARTGLTAAAYARQGFFQMVVVAALVIPLLTVTRALLRPDPAIVRRYTLLALPTVGLLLAMIASAAVRMGLYVRYYGLSTERYYTVAIMAWLAVTLVWLAATTLRGREHRMWGGAVIAGLATLALLNAVVPDVVVARVNIARARRTTAAGASPLDVAHLATLSGDAASPAIAAVLGSPAPTTNDSTAVSLNAERCRAAGRLLTRWGPSSRAAAQADSPGGWRTWNVAERRALRLTAQAARELRVVQRTSCVPARGVTAGR